MHCCLAAFYIDNYGYQENILPKIHKELGFEVEILASTLTYITKNKFGYVQPSKYTNEYSIPVTRIGFVKWLPHKILEKLRIYQNVYQELERFKPDVIFLHDIQFLSVFDVIKYVKNYPNTKVYADGHTDFINSARNWLSKYILHKIIYRFCAKSIEPYVTKFWGVTPLRVDFFRDVYGINQEKIDFLELGVDDTIIDFENKANIRHKIRLEHNISDHDFVVITGGKIDRRKNIHVLMKVIKEANFKNLKLIIFGSPDILIKDEYEELLKNSVNIISIPWLTQTEINNYLLSADLAFFPGTHSVLWEQAVGLGIPSVFKRWNRMEHVDVGGSCIFIEEGTYDLIYDVLLKVVNDNELYNELKKNAITKGIERFSYTNIAKKSIEYQKMEN